MPAIGDLFRNRISDVQETVNSLYYLIKQRINDIDSRNDFRQKISKAENQANDAKQQLGRLETKLETAKKEAASLKDKIKVMEQKHKEELQRVTAERDELIKSITKIEHKETQFKHEIKSKDLQITKLQEQMKAKLFDAKKPQGAANKENQTTNIQTHGRIIPSNEVKFSKMSGDNDMSLMIQRSHEEMYKKIQQENHELKDCLKSLQKEMFEIVKLKSDIYMKRFKAEHFNPNDSEAVTSEAIIKNELKKIKEGLFNADFDQQGRDIIHKFQVNFQRLREFMRNVDKGMADLKIFNPSNSIDAQGEDEKCPTSVLQLKELLRNYEGIVESQH